MIKGNSSFPHNENKSCAFEHSMVPLIACNDNMSVVKKSHGAAVFHNNIRMSMFIGKHTDEKILANMKDDELIMNLKFSLSDENQMFMLTYRKVIADVPYYIIAFPALSHLCLPDGVECISNILRNIKPKLKAEMRRIAMKVSLTEQFDDEHEFLHCYPWIACPGLYLSERSATKTAFIISKLFDRYKEDFDSLFDSHGCTLNLNVSDQLLDMVICMYGSEDNIFSLFTIFIMTLYLISSDQKIDISVKRTRNDNAIVKFKTEVTSDFFHEIHSWFISSKGSIGLNTLAVGFLRIGHPFALDILLVSDFIEINNWTASFNRKDNQYIFSVSMPYSSEIPAQTDISVSSRHSTVLSDIVRDVNSLVKHSSAKPTADTRQKPKNVV